MAAAPAQTTNYSGSYTCPGTISMLANGLKSGTGSITVQAGSQQHINGSTTTNRLLCGLVLGCLSLTGCTATQGGPTVTSTWVEPGWMAQVRQENEVYQSGQVACYAEYGFTAVKEMSGSVGFWNVPNDPATQALFETASADCNARVPLPAYQDNKTLDAAAYERMLDTRACIVAHGFAVSEAPSLEVWMDSDVSSAWNPYGNLATPLSKIPPSDLAALDQACPQPGPNFVAFASPPQ